MAGTQRSYGGVSADDRRADRRERLLDAGLELLGSDGLAGTTVRGVCKQADLGPRYFYESFDDLDALVVAVFDRVAAETLTRIFEAIQDTEHDAYARSRAAIETLVDFYADDPRRARVAFIEALGNEQLAKRRLDFLRAASRALAELGREFYGAADDDRLVDVTASLLIGGTTELLIAWIGGDLELTRDELVDDLTELYVANGEAGAAISARRSNRSRRKG